jgi:hypothetical protein
MESLFIDSKRQALKVTFVIGEEAILLMVEAGLLNHWYISI